MANQAKQFVSITEAANQIGMSRQALFKYISSGQLAAVKIGKGARSPYIVLKSDFDKWRDHRISDLRNQLAMLERKGR